METKVFRNLLGNVPEEFVSFVSSKNVQNVIPIVQGEILDSLIVLYDESESALKQDVYKLTMEVGRLKQENEELSGALDALRRINDWQDKLIEKVKLAFKEVNNVEVDKYNVEVFLEGFENGKN